MIIIIYHLNIYTGFVDSKQIREEIVQTVSSFCKTNDLDYRMVWKQIYQTYGERYHIWPDVDYKFGHKNKLDFLTDYEVLYGTLTKMYNLVQELKN